MLPIKKAENLQTNKKTENFKTVKTAFNTKTVKKACKMQKNTETVYVMRFTVQSVI